MIYPYLQSSEGHTDCSGATYTRINEFAIIYSQRTRLIFGTQHHLFLCSLPPLITSAFPYCNYSGEKNSEILKCRERRQRHPLPMLLLRATLQIHLQRNMPLPG